MEASDGYAQTSCSRPLDVDSRPGCWRGGRGRLDLGNTGRAHEGSGETEVGYLLVQQALGHLAHDKTSSGMDGAMEKIGDVLNTKDQAGVNIAEVQQAKAAMEAGQAIQAQALLQHSITEAVSKLMPATGEETGTKVVSDPLPGRGALGSGGWAFLAASLLFLVLGSGLAYRFKPADTVGRLRERLGTPTYQQTIARPVAPSKDAS